MLRLQTFGTLALLRNGVALDGPTAQPRRLTLLAILAAAGPTGVNRDRLVGLFWPRTDPARARHTLSQWIFLIRKDFGADAVIAGTTELRLAPGAIGSDVIEFDAAVARGDVDAVVAIHVRPFLEGTQLGDSVELALWVKEARHRRLVEYRAAVESVASRRAAQGDLSGSIEAWRRLVATDPSDGRATLALVRALRRHGDEAGAQVHARAHVVVLRETLDSLADPELVALAESADLLPTIAVARSPRPRWRRLGRWALLPFAALAAAATMGALASVPAGKRAILRQLMTRGRATLDRQRVVVAPLENLTGDTSFAALGDLSADWMAQAIARTDRLDVVDARTSFATARLVDRIPRWLRARERPIALAEETGAAAVVSGRIYRSGDSLRVYVQMTDVVTGRLRGVVGPITGSVRDIPALVGDAARRTAALTAASVDSSAGGRIAELAPPPSYEAYRETGRAWESYFVGDFSAFFAHAARAVAVDSSYAPPLILTAVVHAELREWQTVDSILRRLEPRLGALSRAERATLDVLRSAVAGDLPAQFRAAQADARLAHASPEASTHAAHLGVLANRPRAALEMLRPLDPTRGVLLAASFYWTWSTAALHELGDYESERAMAERGLRQFPSRPAAQLSMCRALAALGRMHELRALAEHAESDRGDRAAFHRRLLLEGARELAAHGHASAAHELLAATLAEYDRAAADSSLTFLRVRARLLAEFQRHTEALAVMQRVQRRAPGAVSTAGELGVLAAARGDRAEATRLSRILATTPRPFMLGRQTLWRARIAAILGDTAAALALLEQAVGEGYPVAQGYAMPQADPRYYDPGELDLHADPAFLALHVEPRFRRLLEPQG